MSRTSLYTPEQVSSWVEKFRLGKSHREIAADACVPMTSVYWHLRRVLGTEVRRRVGRKRIHFGVSESEVARRTNLKRHYGLTVTQFGEMSQSQGGVCAICGNAPKGGKTSTKNLHVDHDHQTGKVRGLLCHKCNPGLGQFREDPALLRKAAEYLEQAR